MLGRGPNRRFADVMERALYNGALPGLSLDGATFFYENPLESRGAHNRWIWHHCPCCPPNIARLIGAIGTYMYGVSDNAVAVHLYGESTARITVAGAKLTLTQEGDYPWAETVTIRLGLDQQAQFALHLRVPDWAGKATLALNGAAAGPVALDAAGYVTLDRAWADGDSVTLHLPMDARVILPHPRIKADTGRVALMRGPLVYCAEAADNGADLDMMALPASLGAVQTARVADLGGAVAVDVTARVDSDAAWGNTMYTTNPPRAETAVRRFIPYHLWDNRGAGEMRVWVRRAAE